MGSPEEWMGFQAVWRAATTLHGIVVERLCRANVPCISFSPSAVCMCSDGRAVQWDISPLLAAIDAGLVPVVHGDVCFDTRRGGTVLSTESVFAFLAEQFCSLKRRVDRVMVCGIEDRVYSDFPHNTTLLATVGDRHVSAGNDNDQKPNEAAITVTRQPVRSGLMPIQACLLPQVHHHLFLRFAEAAIP